MPIIRAANHVEEYRARALGKDIGLMSGRADHQRTVRVTEHILELLPISDLSVLIDVGCGDGTLISMVRAKRAIGVAPTEEEVARVRSTYPDAEFVRAMAQNLPFDSGFADLLICNGVLITLENEKEVRKALCEFARVTNGRIFIGEIPCEPLPHPQNSCKAFLLSRWQKKGFRSLLGGMRILAKAVVSDYTFFTYPNEWFYSEPAQFRRIVEECGMRVDQLIPTPHVPGRFDYLLTR